MNSEQQQQRIMGYFIEEAREHLQTIEQGVLNLQDVLNDSESVNELFRAAHSIKGGAAMLGVGSIQHVAHRLEDFFKILKENPQMTVDERLKSLLLAGFDPLSELLDELQGGYKISNELTIETNNRVKPVFAELESYLNQLVSDTDGEISTDTFRQPEESIPQPQELVLSQQSIFQQEVTTKMRDMLQLFRATDNAESRSQLQAVCNYFQEIGNNFDLRNWTNLVTQIKNAIAQSSNSYRTLAPILIRELKEAQDLVLVNRELEIAVSLQLQNLLPYRFSEPEEDEVSTIFTTASGNIGEDSNVDNFAISDTSITSIDRDLDLNPDVDIDLFADQVNEEIFDLPDTRKNQVDQMDWMDGEYEITENQHIDGPKVGASELKSLAILFENDDIDFDAAWEDIESNETNIANHGSPETSDSHDEFADLLDNNSDNNNDVTVPNLSGGESTIDQLFGEFSDQDLVTEENISSLFPDDLDDSWGEIPDGISEISPEIIPEREQANLDSLFIEDFVTDESLDNQFALDLGMDIVEQISVEQVDDSLSIENQFNDIDINEIDVEENSFSELPSQAETTEQSIDIGLTDTDESQPLSSEEYFAAIARAENEIAGDDDDSPSDPFALTFSEEGMNLLDDPFAIEGSLDAVLLESSPSLVNEEAINADVDDFFEDAEKIVSNDYSESIFRNSDSDGIDTTGLNVFDELGFDNDEFDEASQGVVESSGFASVITDANPNDFLTFTTGSSDVSDNLDLINESIEFIEAPIPVINNAELDDSFYTSSLDEATSNFAGFTEDNETNSAINDADDLADFFAEPSDVEDISDAIANDFDDEFASTDDLGAFFAESDEPAIASDISNNYVDSFDRKFSNTDDLGDFFAASVEPEVSVEVNDELEAFTDRADITEESDDFFSDSEEPEIISNNISDGYIDSFEQEFTNTENLGDFFAASDEPEIFNDIPDSIEPTYEFDNTESLGEFFNTSEDSEIDSSDNSELDDYTNIINNTDNLGNFFDEVEEFHSLTENISNEDSDKFEANLTNSDQFDSVVDRSEEEQESFIDFDSPQNINSDFLSMVDEDISEANPSNLAGEFFQQINSSDDSNLDGLFTNAEEEDLTVLENEINFDQATSLTQSDDINDLTSMLDDNLQDESLKTMESGLTNIQADLNLENNDASAKTTIANLADFFQVDDDSEFNNLLQNSEEELASSNLTDDTPLDFGEFNEFADLDRDISESGFPLIQAPETKKLEPEQQLQTDELNGIDDNFDFDDLEAMIGSSSNMQNDINGVSNRTFDDQITATVINDHISADSNDMNFDELEALLGDSNSFDDAEKTKKATDEFDELENMLQTAFAKDVGPIKTKTPTRQPANTRKPRLTDSTMRVDVKYLDSLNNLVGELVVNRNLLEQDQERLQQFITNLLHQVQLLSDVSQRMRDQYDRSLLEASLTAGRGGRSSYSFDSPSQLSDGSNSNSSVTNDFEGIEFDRYNTFHVLSQEIIELIVRVRESASDIEFVVGETDQVTRQLGTITTQVQDDLKQSRMVPFAQIADRLPRGIRDRALKTGKQAELEIFGRETLIDKAILEQLTDPLTHLVNNAIDHGLEDPSTRQAAGKSATGRLTVRAYHQGNQTVISISDDGAGISTDKVKKSAVSKGVRSQSEVDRLNETEVYALLFEAGFSTAAQADEFKGRGVGLDVVKTCLDDIRGVIIVESVVGKGTTFTIRLPLTLSISKAMFCISDRARIAFPVDGFEDMVEVPQSQIILNEKGQPCLPWRDTVLPFQHLSNLLSYSRHLSRSSIYGKQENDELCIIILRNDTSYLALQVDQFLGEYEIVIKQLEGPIPQPSGIAGATVLGDGRVMAIANVLELFDIASGRLRPSTSGMTIQPIVEEDVAADPTVLIVDDSITVRELLSLTFAKVGYRVEQAKDGQDAWEKLRAGLPCDMIFCDIEMPRMDGLDLLSRLQKDSRLKDIPVAMLTSRGADRHRQSAIQLGAKGYFTKPYLEEELLSASKRLLAGETLPI
ncbi:signal transduction histidine kinase CheA [Pseudanabaena sp. lw0831]|uniref:hybrid sensor histidine kinase/response regulator n=1 Tax=Pseudanabaena sp. lw0831 TaxID=1357935 RepID=UPI001916A64D|nr:hybrid sensor histidine kinase/response regulator [Pseudanabaena sp. lw0831]GBO56363.1 signal transduction histidine kinase CheA [Pseudanabaena sp. lw0831]